MIIVMRPDATKQDVQQLIAIVEEHKLEAVPLYGKERTVIAIIGDARKYDLSWDAFRGVEMVSKVLAPYKLASREHKPEGTTIRIGDVEIGNGNFTVIAGPCSVESREQLFASAQLLKSQGIRIMRASAFKPRTSPYSFQGLGLEGLRLLKEVREQTGLYVETEVMDVRDVQVAAEYVDILRIGARNMQNFDLLKEVGKIRKPVILKRGMSATIEEWIMAAEYILSKGNAQVIFCERGIRTFEDKAYRNTLDIAAVPVLKKKTHLPVIVDPSHAAGDRELIIDLCKAAVAAGADGILVETHPTPEKALSDGAQSLYPEQFARLIKEITPLVNLMGRKL